MLKQLFEAEAEDVRYRHISKVVAADSVSHSNKEVARGCYRRHFR